MAKLALLASKPIKSGNILQLPGQPAFDLVPFEENYNGLRISFPFTLDSVIDMMEYFKKGEILHYNYMSRILYEIYKCYNSQPNLQEITIHQNVRFTIVGDLHGQLEVNLGLII